MCGGFISMKNDEKYMRIALIEAQKAKKRNEVPVGAVIVCDGKVIAKAYNKREKTNDPLGHAELRAIKKASKKLKAWRLVNCDIYVTLEPCIMCAGAIMWSRFRRVIYGATDPKGGALGGSFNIFKEKAVNHIPEITGGLLEREAREMLTTFFQQKRESKTSKGR